MKLILVRHAQTILGHIENKALSEVAEFNLVQGTYAEFKV